MIDYEANIKLVSKSKSQKVTNLFSTLFKIIQIKKTLFIKIQR